MALRSQFFQVALWATLASTSLSFPVSGPSIRLDGGTLVGINNASVDEYLGVPYALPPTGHLRFQLPQPNTPYSGTINATAFGPSCPGTASSSSTSSTNASSSSASSLPPSISAIFDILNGVGTTGPVSEDCLTLNVFVPSGTTPDAKLPVVAWVFGGGFSTGSAIDYNGQAVVKRSVELDEPLIYVSLNYRLSAFGFLSSKEVQEAGVGNLGLRDQRQALRWIQNYIGAFGGDPEKVTIWGESAGSWSVALQLLTNGGNPEGLFRAAFLESGSPLPVGNITQVQSTYDALVADANCTGSADTLQCLREVSFDNLQTAVANATGTLQQTQNLPWQPRVDGDFLPDMPMELVRKGNVANVPIINGDCEDEGTIFGLDATIAGVTVADNLTSWLPTILHGISEEDINSILEAYPDNVTLGSPFGTGTADAITPEYKRISALQGDLVFQAPRRYMLNELSAKQPMWSYLYTKGQSATILGAAHSTDLSDIYGPGDMTDFLINFVNYLNPNNKTGLFWPQYNTTSRAMMTFLDGTPSVEITQDTFREEQISLMATLGQKYPF
ncbi:alpha/beta-hydrolase [Obba rivulosa]|uniref:Carboxylic ester hydrolase n=1 Tax=Obba rivulosa TaxID=1052685 RepID=A0A8E2B3B2_9APHY|nr:alpha/beta-hydrolase [Obba rivulosa]